MKKAAKYDEEELEILQAWEAGTLKDGLNNSLPVGVASSYFSNGEISRATF